jgi:DNA-binding XRE family transcriptional regulator
MRDSRSGSCLSRVFGRRSWRYHLYVARRETPRPSPDVLRALGTQVKRIRLDQGLSQTAVADAAGITYKHLGRIELAQSEAGADMLVRIAKALGVTVGELFETITPAAAQRRKRLRV